MSEESEEKGGSTTPEKAEAGSTTYRVFHKKHESRTVPASELLKYLADGWNTQPERHWSEVLPRTYNELEVETYIEERFNPRIRWYDNKAGWAKKRYIFVQATTVVGGALVPVFVNLDLGFAGAATTIRIVTTVISILVVILVALEGVLHYREQWVNYRSTEQTLRKEYYHFIAGDGPYADCEEGADEAGRMFIERVEQALASESASTLQILTSTSDASSKEAKPTVKGKG